MSGQVYRITETNPRFDMELTGLLKETGLVSREPGGGVVYANRLGSATLTATVGEVTSSVDVTVGEDPSQLLVLINPELVSEKGRQVDEEGCLSFPGLYFDVLRHHGAVIEYQDAEGNSCRLKDNGLLARIAQHEMDHLDGILFIDRIPAWRRFWLGPRLLWVVLAGFLARKWNGQ